MDIKWFQEILNRIGFNAGPEDGELGNRTSSAIKEFQKEKGITPTGTLTKETEKAVVSQKVPQGLIKARAKIEAPGKPAGGNKWPLQRDVPQFFGPVGGPDTQLGKCHLVLPMKLAWNLSERVNSFSCHTKVANELTTIFAETVKHYGENEWRRLRLDLWGGCRAVRLMRGGTQYSMHSWGIAVDIDSENNQLHWDRKRATLAKADYIPFWNIVESTGAVSLGRARNFDWMHFQFARLG